MSLLLSWQGSCLLTSVKTQKDLTFLWSEGWIPSARYGETSRLCVERKKGCVCPRGSGQALG